MARSFQKTPASYLGCEAQLPTYPYTVSLRFRVDDLESDHLLFARSAWDNWTNRDEIVVAGTTDGDPVRATVGREDGSSISAPAFGLTADRWHHAVAVFECYLAAWIWLDGVSGIGIKPTIPTEDPYLLDRFWLGGGRDASGFGQGSDGALAEVAVWTVADLSADEIGALARGACPRRIRPASLLAYWPLGGLYGPTDHDRWQQRYAMTPTGDPQWTDHPGVFYGRAVQSAGQTRAAPRAPYRSCAGRVWHTGAQAGSCHTAGAQAGRVLENG